MFVVACRRRRCSPSSTSRSAPPHVGRARPASACSSARPTTRRRGPRRVARAAGARRRSLVGVALGMSGGALQSVARNPLASPDTLAVNAGAYFTVVAGRRHRVRAAVRRSTGRSRSSAGSPRRRSCWRSPPAAAPRPDPAGARGLGDALALSSLTIAADAPVRAGDTSGCSRGARARSCSTGTQAVARMAPVVLVGRARLLVLAATARRAGARRRHRLGARPRRPPHARRHRPARRAAGGARGHGRRADRVRRPVRAGDRAAASPARARPAAAPAAAAARRRWPAAPWSSPPTCCCASLVARHRRRRHPDRRRDERCSARSFMVWLAAASATRGPARRRRRRRARPALAAARRGRRRARSSSPWSPRSSPASSSATGSCCSATWPTGSPARPAAIVSFVLDQRTPRVLAAAAGRCRARPRRAPPCRPSRATRSPSRACSASPAARASARSSRSCSSRGASIWLVVGRRVRRGRAGHVRAGLRAGRRGAAELRPARAGRHRRLGRRRPRSSRLIVLTNPWNTRWR